MVALEWKGWNWRGRETGGVHADLPQKKGEEWGECNHRTRNARTNSDFAVFRDLVKIKILSKRRGRVEEIRIRVGFGEKVGQEDMGKEGWVLVDCPTR